MTTTFFLDPRVLDDCIGDGGKDVEIEGKGAAYFSRGHSELPVCILCRTYGREQKSTST